MNSFRAFVSLHSDSLHTGLPYPLRAGDRPEWHRTHGLGRKTEVRVRRETYYPPIARRTGDCFSKGPPAYWVQ